MKKANVLLVFCLLFGVISAQKKNVNDYKYVIVPIQFEFLKGKDAYRVNTLTKYLFKEAGFETYFDEQELPEDLFKDRCLALYANVEDLKGGFLKTNIQITLKDCYGEAVVISKIGDSKEKMKKDAYNEAIREAFETIQAINYSYSPKETTEKDTTNSPAKVATVVMGQSEKVTSESTEIKSNSEIIAEDKQVMPKPSKSITTYLTLKPVTLGFEVLDNQGKVTMVLLATSSRDIFIVKGKSAIVYKTGDGTYMYSENDGSSIIQKPMQIKF